MKKGDAGLARPLEKTLWNKEGLRGLRRPHAIAGPAARAEGGVDRPAVLRDTRFSVHEETADEPARGVMRRCEAAESPS